MTDMADLSIEREILVEAPAEVVWRTITEPDRIERWFADRVDLDVRPGGTGTLAFEDRATSRRVTVPVVVEAVEPPYRLAFRWSHPEGSSPAAGNSMLVEFLLSPEGEERTRLRVRETGLDELPWDGDEKADYAEDHRHGWSVHFGRLGDLLGTRRG